MNIRKMPETARPMMRIWTGIVVSVLMPMVLSGDPATPPSAADRPTAAFPLWINGAPLAHGADPDKDIPTLTPFWPAVEKASGAAVVICPGGGYRMLSPYEGKDYAEFL